MIEPTADDILDAVADAVERSLAPACAGDDYAASLCRTVVQLLRAVRVRVGVEQAALAEGNTELRALLAMQEDLPAAVAERVRAALAAQPEPVYPALPDLRADAVRLRAALSAVIEAIPDQDHPARASIRVHLARQLERERVWQQDTYTGPRR